MDLTCTLLGSTASPCLLLMMHRTLFVLFVVKLTASPVDAWVHPSFSLSSSLSSSLPSASTVVLSGHHDDRSEIMPLPPWRGLRQLLHIGPWGVRWDRLRRSKVTSQHRHSTNEDSTIMYARQRPATAAAIRDETVPTSTYGWIWEQLPSNKLPSLKGHECQSGEASETTIQATFSQNIRRVVIISDTHGKHECLKIPECDILIHCGDILQRYGYYGDVGAAEVGLQQFDDWLSKQPAAHKLIIGGNHDKYLDSTTAQGYSTKSSGALLNDKERLIDVKPDLYSWKPKHGTLLNGSQNVCGLCIFGSPYSPPGVTSNTGFQDPAIWKYHETVLFQTNSSQVDVLVTHARCAEVEAFIQQTTTTMPPRVWAHGHFHDQYGIDAIHFGNHQDTRQTRMNPPNTTLLVNAATCDMIYRPVNPPIVIDLDMIPIVEPQSE